MAANLPPVEETPETPEPERSEPAPDLMGYGSVEELVAAKRASDAEAKRMAERLEQAEFARQSPAAVAQTEAPIDWAAVRGGYATPEETARATSAVADALIIKDQRDQERDALSDIDDRAMRAEVKAHLESERKLGRSMDVQAAKDAVEARKLREKNATLEEALRREQANKRDPEERRVTAPNTPREISATEKKRTMTYDEFDEEQADLPMHEAMKRQAEILKNQTELKRRR